MTTTAVSRAPIVTAIVVSLACVAIALPGMAAALAYDSTRPGEVWRFFTCHLAHWTPSHFVWSVAVFVLLGTLCERFARRGYAWCLVMAAVAIPSALKAVQPELRFYAGLSGIDAALFALCAAQMLRDARGPASRLLPALMLAAFGAKLAWELVVGTALFAPGEGIYIPVPVAHAVGGAAGLIASMLHSLRATRSPGTRVPPPAGAAKRMERRAIHGLTPRG